MDLTFYKNGRSTSDISIHNYPEHLNPFYEDDNHERIKSLSLQRPGKIIGRSRYFFADGSKTIIWPLKSMFLTKKSSTLGIAKTSESPPVIRRYHNTYAGQTRSLNSVNAFSSLNHNHIFHGKDQQEKMLSKARENLIGPNNVNQPISQSAVRSVSSLSLPRRSSQTSLISNNPFESDNDSTNNTFVRRKSFKKRRAPLPPDNNKASRTETISAIGQPLTTSKPSNLETNANIKKPIHDIENCVSYQNKLPKSTSTDPVERINRMQLETIELNLDSKIESKNKITMPGNEMCINECELQGQNAKLHQDTISNEDSVVKTNHFINNDSIKGFNKLHELGLKENNTLHILEHSVSNQSSSDIKTAENVKSFNVANLEQNSQKTIKRKSVNEIIESINRSQRILNESAARGTKTYSKALYTNMNELSSLKRNYSPIFHANNISH